MEKTKEVLHTQGEQKKIAEFIWQRFEAFVNKGEHFDADVIAETIYPLAVTERQRLIDSNRELLSIVTKLDTWHKLSDGVFTYTNPKHDGDQLAIDLQEAINNAKNNIQ